MGERRMSRSAFLQDARNVSSGMFLLNRSWKVFVCSTGMNGKRLLGFCLFIKIPLLLFILVHLWRFVQIGIVEKKPSRAIRAQDGEVMYKSGETGPCTHASNRFGISGVPNGPGATPVRNSRAFVTFYSTWGLCAESTLRWCGYRA